MEPMLSKIAITVALAASALLPYAASAQRFDGPPAWGWAYGGGLWGLIGLAATVFWVLMIIHAATHNIPNKLIWVLILIFTGIVGALIYYFIVARRHPPLIPPV